MLTGTALRRTLQMSNKTRLTNQELKAKRYKFKIWEGHKKQQNHKVKKLVKGYIGHDRVRAEGAGIPHTQDMPLP